MSSSRPSQSSTTSARSKHSARIIAQTTIDAKLHADFEESGDSFDYSSSVRVTSVAGDERKPKSDRVTTAYLNQIQKGKFIQPFGCLLALDEKTFKVIAFSENAPEMLTMVSHAVPSVGELPALGIGTDIRTIFTGPSAAALQKALGFGEVSLLNPVLVHCKTSGKPYYAIVHRVTGSLIIDFEPVKPYEVPMTAAGALQSYKLAAKAITRLQALPSGSMERLCDTMVQEVFELTGYDRVMTYKFHDDDHGEVVAEITKPGLDPYLGLHYPATDIPQAARFLFMKNKVRMICDCRAKHVKVVQDEKLPFDLTLCGSTLRAPHYCHLQYMENMSSIASLVMAVVVNDGDEEGESSDSTQSQKRKRLWGLVVCHNTTPRFVPFPLRYACEFLAQVFAIHVNKELELESQILEKNILRTQTLLCDMLMRDAPLGIVSQSPNIMDLVKCDGAALLYKNKIHRLGMTPSDFQLHDIVSWLSEYHTDSTGLSTDSLYDAGFPGALALGDVVCGMAAVRISDKGWLFWYRSHTAAEVRWGGAKHEPGEKDDGRKMHPRSSFKAFLEVVKTRSVPWKDYEMDAIHSLQLILRNASKDADAMDSNTNIIHTKLNDLKIDGLQELEAVTAEMVRLIETASVPIFAVDVDGQLNGWNTKIAELTGLPVDEAIGNHLLTLVEDSSVDTVSKMLELALQGKEERNVEFEIKTHGPSGDSSPISLIVNACASRDVGDSVVGVCFIAQDITGQKNIMDKFTRIEGDYRAIIQNPHPLIPPIFGTDQFGWCSEWNSAMTKLTGWRRDDVIDKMLLGEVFGTQAACCRLKNQEAFVNFGVVLNNAMTGQECAKISFGFFARNGKYVECLLCVSKRLDREGAVTGLFCFLQLASHELQQALHIQRLSEQTALKRLKVLAYIRRQIRNPLSGIIFSRKMLEGTNLGEEQKNILRTSSQCQRQLNKILDDTDLDSIIDGYLDLEMLEFKLHEVLVASISQIMMKSNGKNIMIVNDMVEDLLNETLYGDSPRLQQVLANFLLVCVNSTPSGGQLSISGTLTKDRIGESVQLALLEVRISHTGGGVPEELLSQMFGTEAEASEEGISLLISRKLVKLMNGEVQYLREAGKELIRRCMANIDATLNKEQPPIIDQWKEFQSTKSGHRESAENVSVNKEEEISEIDMLWKEMELALASCYLLDDSEDSHVQYASDVRIGAEIRGEVCRHDYRLNEEIGIICRLCGFVSTEIKDVPPPFMPSANYSSSKEQRTEEATYHKQDEDGLDSLSIPASSNAPSSSGEGEGNVWALIPDLRNKLRVHQKRAFEFLWKNIAGSVVPAEMEPESKKRGGCVISHTPGAGKTLLIIAFLVSYLKLFPGSRPLVLAPKTTLYTWYKEVLKWKIPVPVYQIHGGQTYKGEVLREKMKLCPGLPRNQDVMHVLDCLEKMQMWLSQPSVLLMGYTSFLTLTREDSPYAHRKYMAQVLTQCPGLLILDEGHNPRSTKSRLRKGLMKVNTRLRILLSGTLFQNNFGEYFNTLTLARPIFVDEVLKELDPKYKKKNKGASRFSLENRARKMFIDKISSVIDSDIPKKRKEGLNILKKLTGGFIDVYDGGSSDRLPGLQCYTLMMKSTTLQQEILVKLQNQRPIYKGFPLELELLITLGAIHPWLIRTTACSSQYFKEEELEALQQFKFDLKLGSKVKFVMSLIPRCLLRKEKVLIFCHNIAPINLFLEIFERFYGWRKGIEALVLQGDIELFQRGRIMDQFEEPGGPSKVMLASITTCAEGISLTAASRVILLDSEWNPSKSKQAIARAFRPGQDKVVYVYQLLATGTLEEEKYKRTTWKEWVSSMIFSEDLVEDPSHWQAPKIEDELLREIVEEDRATLFHAIMKNEKASNMGSLQE